MLSRQAIPVLVFKSGSCKMCQTDVDKHSIWVMVIQKFGHHKYSWLKLKSNDERSTVHLDE